MSATVADGAGGRVLAIARRHWFVLRRSPHRWFDVLIWPLVDALLFGSLGVYVARQDATGSDDALGYLLAGILLFHVIYQSQIAVSTGFLEETWSRNLLNLMTTPLREVEYAAGVALFGLVKLAIGIGVVALAAIGFYSFNILDVGWGLLPIGALLLVCQSAEVLAWGILFVVMPLSGVFYPVDALPPLLQPIAWALPTTHLFIAARELLGGNAMPWDQLVVATLGCVVAAALGLAYLTRMLAVFRRRGFVTRFS
jgi:ABC-2 type transport system permease protein